MCLFSAFAIDDEALRTRFQREGREDGIQGPDISEELPDDFGGKIFCSCH